MLENCPTLTIRPHFPARPDWFKCVVKDGFTGENFAYCQHTIRFTFPTYKHLTLWEANECRTSHLQLNLQQLGLTARNEAEYGEMKKNLAVRQPEKLMNRTHLFPYFLKSTWTTTSNGSLQGQNNGDNKLLEPEGLRCTHAACNNNSLPAKLLM